MSRRAIGSATPGVPGTGTPARPRRPWWVDTGFDAEPDGDAVPVVHGALPVEVHEVGRIEGHPIVDLRRLSLEQWYRAMLPLSPLARRASLRHAGLESFSRGVVHLWTALEQADRERRDAIAAEIDRPLEAQPPLRWRQVSVRLTPAQHDDLRRAGAALGMKPSTLVRQLITAGVGRVLYELRRRERP